jgi:hypothetical protein
MVSKRKKTYDLMSPKIKDKRRAKAEAGPLGAIAPATIDNYRVNNPRMARSLNIQPVIQEKRQLADTEGMPAVNGKSGKELVQKAVKPVGSRVEEVNAADAAIKPGTVKKKKEVVDVIKSETKGTIRGRSKSPKGHN